MDLDEVKGKLAKIQRTAARGQLEFHIGSVGEEILFEINKGIADVLKLIEKEESDWNAECAAGAEYSDS